MTRKHPFLVWADRVEAGEPLTIVPPEHRALIAWAVEQRQKKPAEYQGDGNWGNPGKRNALKGLEWTKPQILVAVKQRAKELGRLPTRRELRSPSLSTIQRHFGTLSACFAAAKIS